MPTTFAIASVELVGIHGHQSIRQDLKPGLNILYGKNGTGKTTLLHVLTNLLDRQIQRFCYIHFKTIRVRTIAGAEIILQQRRTAKSVSIEVTVDKAVEVVDSSNPVRPSLHELLRIRLGGRPVYLPAFRSILEGTTESRRASARTASDEQAELDRIIKHEADESKQLSRPQGSDTFEAIAQKTVLCRKWFGPFTPIVRYPSLRDVSHEMDNELQQAAYEVAWKGQSTLSDVFVQVLEEVLGVSARKPSEDVNAILDRIRANLTEMNQLGPYPFPPSYERLAKLVTDASLKTTASEAARILAVYDAALTARAEAKDQAFRPIRRFVNSVNRFLEGKELVYIPMFSSGPRAGLFVQLPDNRQSSLSILSSGERQILTMIFATTHMASNDGIVLLDEPEISLHVDWQRMIISELKKQVGDRQIIACTHSPEVAAEHRESLVPLTTQNWTSAEPSVEDEPASESDS